MPYLLLDISLIIAHNSGCLTLRQSVTLPTLLQQPCTPLLVKAYLSKLLNVFVQIANYICPNWKLYSYTLQHVFECNTPHFVTAALLQQLHCSATVGHCQSVTVVAQCFVIVCFFLIFCFILQTQPMWNTFVYLCLLFVFVVANKRLLRKKHDIRFYGLPAFYLKLTKL